MKKIPQITPQLIQDLLEVMSNGATDSQASAYLNLSKTAFTRLLKQVDDPMYEELLEAYELGQTKCEAYFEKIGQSLMTGKIVGKEAVWKAFMQNKFKWSDKTENKDLVDKWDDTKQSEYDALLDKAKSN